ncbi:hypothetical protein [Fontivita pretiosa]|uniref:hypothetical protein n=1 Tax=Fontivita pretiosa TaxID=2989684 RepID=UPI003D171630
MKLFKAVAGLVSKLLILIGCVVGCVWLTWRSYTYVDDNYTMTPPVMCAMLSVSLMFLGLSIAFRNEQEMGEE